MCSCHGYKQHLGSINKRLTSRTGKVINHLFTTCEAVCRVLCLVESSPIKQRNIGKVVIAPSTSNQGGQGMASMREAERAAFSLSRDKMMVCRSNYHLRLSNGWL